MPDKAYLQVSELSRAFTDGGRTVKAIDRISFDVRQGAFLSILGPSGCGKSTLFNVIAGLAKPDAGTVVIDGASVVDRPGQVGYMLQRDLLLPWRSIVDNIMLGQTLAGRRKALAQKEVLPLMERCGLAGFEQSRPHQLSGGMRQRAALLRTLLTGKEVLLLDEPFGALDAITRMQLQMLLTDVWQEMRKTILFVTHDVDEALMLSDEILLLTARPGRVIKRFQVTLDRPRRPEMLADPTTAAMKAEMMSLLWKEVRRDEQA